MEGRRLRFDDLAAPLARHHFHETSAETFSSLADSRERAMAAATNYVEQRYAARFGWIDSDIVNVQTPEPSTTQHVEPVLEKTLLKAKVRAKRAA